ncbi:LicD family protein [Ferrimonas sediminicola]|uniref:LicD family protein n=1 Tax=Ferrimonas sediminicola TaxID=2569538 RepID=A0A4U1BC35_9GAMM|nr:LicD family protein [Ferrimonas sediminicola]TKB47591.1 LicD family protein [Ferrimonas sediminicola]
MKFPVQAPWSWRRVDGGPKLDMSVAEHLLFAVAECLDREGIVYHLEGGTLLGIVRDGRLLPWDKDLDISVSDKDIARTRRVLRQVFWAGWKLKSRNFSVKGSGMSGIRILKLEDRTGGLFHSGHDYLDIFTKTRNGKHVYWQAAGKIMRVDAKYYDGFEEVAFKGRLLKVPLHHREYLTEKYGDWSQVVKEWDCAKDEKCIVT